MGTRAKQAQGRRGQKGDTTQGQGTHVPCPSVTSQAKGHWTTCLFLPQEGQRKPVSSPHTTGQARSWGSRGKHPGLGNLSTLGEPALRFPVRMEKRPDLQLLSSS